MNVFQLTNLGKSMTTRPLAVGGSILLIVFQCCCYVYSTYQQPLTDDELEGLDPKGVVELYWASALSGDTETIKRIVGLPGKSMYWDCPREEITSDSKGEGFEIVGPSPDVDFDKPIDNLEWILLDSKTIKIAGKPLTTHYGIMDYKSFGSEAKAVVRPKDAPNSTNSRVFFLLNDGERWRIVAIKSEDHLKFVGNKKFGEARECPPNEQKTAAED